jgi:hypothetical protein
MVRAFTTLVLIGVCFGGTSVFAQNAYPSPRIVLGDEALKTLRAELDEASRVWATKYRAATSDEERSQLQVHNSYRAFEPRFLEFARAHATEPEAMEAVQWLAETANPGSDLDDGLALVQRHHLEDERIIKMCQTLVFRNSPGIERFLLAVAGKHSDYATQGVAYLCLARHLNSFRDFVVAINKMDEKQQESYQHSFDEEGEEIVAWIRSTDPTQLAARIDAIGEKIINEFGDVNDDEYADATGHSRSIAGADACV